MQKHVRTALVDLALDALLISHGKLDGPLNTPDEHRNTLANHLERVVVNSATMLHHRDELGRLNVVPQATGKATLRKALCRGVTALDGNELATLALDVVGLNSLAHAIAHEQPAPWHKAIKQEGGTVKKVRKEGQNA
jgi:hypothetical protein